MNVRDFTKRGMFLMLALDHRESFKRMMNAKNADSVSDADAAAMKRDIIAAALPICTGLLIDPDMGIPGYREAVGNFEKPERPFLVCMEKSGYGDYEGERLTTLEYAAKDIKAMGAHGAKLLLYVNPFAKEAMAKQIAVAGKALMDARKEGLPFFLELVTYQKPTDEQVNRDELIAESITQFLDAGVVPDVWKLEYPGGLECCEYITDLVGETPWILLTRGVEFDVFAEQLQDAVRGGARGFLAGRALWQEALELKGDALQTFLQETLPDRITHLAEIAMES